MNWNGEWSDNEPMDRAWLANSVFALWEIY